MTIRKGLMLVSAMIALGSFAAASAVDTQIDDAAARAERWKALQEAIFGNRKVLDGNGIIELDAPPRALDAALVPIGLQLSADKSIKAVYLVIDNNPSPLAAHITFGPKADARSIKLRVRVNEYTFMHAVAETTDGKLYATEKYVKAAGGCSAPAGSDDKEALKDIGRMKLRLLGEFAAGEPIQAQLMIRHPNFNGMQMNQVTRFYTPPRFIKSTEVTYEGSKVFHLESDISISTDPVIIFGFVPQAKGELQVAIRDSDDATFSGSFDVPGAAASASSASSQ